MRAQALVPAETDRDGLVPAGHGDQVQRHVDDEVALDGAPVQLDDLAELRRADLHHVRRILGVVVVKAVRVVRGVDLLADHVPDLLRFHAAVDTGRDDDLHVVDAVVGELLEHDGEHAFPCVRALHRRERDGDVVDGDRHLHPRPELRVERLGVQRVTERVADRRLVVLQRRDRGLCIDAARPGGQIHLHELIAREEDPGPAARVERNHAGMIHCQAALPSEERVMTPSGRTSASRKPSRAVRASCRGSRRRGAPRRSASGCRSSCR